MNDQNSSETLFEHPGKNTDSRVEYHNIRPSDEPRRCYTVNDIEEVIGIHYKCNTCKTTFSTATTGYNEKYIWWERPGKGAFGKNMLLNISILSFFVI
jgi:hypothetical protein